MKILFAAVPAAGHQDPLTPIAAHLAASGHDVRWYAGPRYGSKLEALGMTVLSYRRATEVTADNVNDVFPERARLRGPKLLAFDLRAFFVANVAAHYDDICELHLDFPFDLCLCDAAFYAEQLIANHLQVPVIAVAQPSVLTGEHDPPPFFGLRPARSVVGRATHRVVRTLIASTTKAGERTYNAVLADHGLPPIPRGGFPHAPMAAASSILLYGTPGFEFPGYRPPANATYVGHLAPVRQRAGGPSSLPPAVLDASGPVVVVSQGTVDNADTSKLIVPTLEALRDRPGVVVATTGGVDTDQLRRRFDLPNFVIEDFVDYEQLFPHADVFVTNGGYGSVMAALHHGVPVVCAGTREGKNDNNVRVGFNRLGIDLRTERPRPRAVEAAVQQVLRDGAIRAQVDRVRAELDAYDTMGIVDAAITGVTRSTDR